VLSVAVGWREVGKVDIYTCRSQAKGLQGIERPAEEGTTEACIVEQPSIFIVFVGGFRWWWVCQGCRGSLVFVSSECSLMRNAGDCGDVVLGPRSLPWKQIPNVSSVLVNIREYR
jgi:hypothetical protein